MEEGSEYDRGDVFTVGVYLEAKFVCYGKTSLIFSQRNLGVFHGKKKWRV